MLCPVCQSLLDEMTLDQQRIAHCANCGATYFDEDGINRITLDSAQRLAESKKVHAPEPAIKPCPYDNSALMPAHNPEAIPSHVSLYLCPTCHCVLASAQDLLEFKQAQSAKINYIKTWRMPLGSLRNVFAVFVMAALSVGMYYTYQSAMRMNTMKTEASQTIQNVTISRSSRFGIVSFRTNKPYRSSIVLINKTVGKTIIVPAAKDEATIHTASFSLPNETDIVYYRIRLISTTGETDSAEAPLEIR